MVKAAFPKQSIGPLLRGAGEFFRPDQRRHFQPCAHGVMRGQHLIGYVGREAPKPRTITQPMTHDTAANLADGAGPRRPRGSVVPYMTSMIPPVRYTGSYACSANIHRIRGSFMISATQMRPGMVVKFNNDLYLRFQRESPDARQPARFRAGQDAQPAQRHDDRAPLLFGRPRGERRAGRTGDGVSVRRRRVLLLHEHRKLRADAPDEGPAGRCGPVIWFRS